MARFSSAIALPQLGSPAVQAGRVMVYGKSDGALYYLRADGVEIGPLAATAVPAVTSQSAAYTAGNNQIVLANGTFTVTLPAPVANAQVVVKNTGTGTITVSSTALIDGASTAVLGQRYASLTVVSDGTTFFVV